MNFSENMICCKVLLSRESITGPELCCSAIRGHLFTGLHVVIFLVHQKSESGPEKTTENKHFCLSFGWPLKLLRKSKCRSGDERRRGLDCPFAGLVNHFSNQEL